MTKLAAARMASKTPKAFTPIVLFQARVRDLFVICTSPTRTVTVQLLGLSGRHGAPPVSARLRRLLALSVRVRLGP